MTLPSIPKSVYSALGPLTVGFMSKKRAKKLGLVGFFEFTRRRIKIASGMTRNAEWETLWHEIIHCALTDSGARGNVLTKVQEEVVCDALGTHLTAMMLDGSLTVTSPGTRKAKMK
jgi:hypothetical protein